MGPQSGDEHFFPQFQRGLPEISRGQAAFVAAPGVVDEDVEPTLLFFHALEQGFDLFVLSVVAAHGDAAAAAGRDFISRVVNRARPPAERWPTAHTAPGDVDSGTALAEYPRDAAPHSAARPGDDSNLVLKIRRIPSGHLSALFLGSHCSLDRIPLCY